MRTILDYRDLNVKWGKYYDGGNPCREFNKLESCYFIRKVTEALIEHYLPTFTKMCFIKFGKTNAIYCISNLNWQKTFSIWFLKPKSSECCLFVCVQFPLLKYLRSQLHWILPIANSLFNGRMHSRIVSVSRFLLLTTQVSKITILDDLSSNYVGSVSRNYIVFQTFHGKHSLPIYMKNRFFTLFNTCTLFWI